MYFMYTEEQEIEAETHPRTGQGGEKSKTRDLGDREETGYRIELKDKINTQYI